MRASEAGSGAMRVEVREREIVRKVRVPVREPGDVNLSTLLNVLMLGGIVMAMLV